MKRITLFSLIILVLLSLSACGGKAEDKKSGNQQQSIVIGTGGAGGLFNLVGTGMADVISKYNPDIKTSAQGTAASVENVRLTNAKKVDISLASSDSVFFGYKGEREFKQTNPDIRALMGTYCMAVHILARKDSGIKTLQDLKGKKIAVGAPGGAPDAVSKVILDGYLGFKRDVDYKPVFISVQESCDGLKDKAVDVAIILLGVPTASIIDLSQNVPTEFIPVDESILNKVVADNPYWNKMVIKKEAYKGLDKDVPAISVPTLIIANKDISDDAAYRIVKTLIEHKDDLAKIHSSGAEFSIENSTKGVAIPFHNGAKKYLTEKGVQIKQ